MITIQPPDTPKISKFSLLVVIMEKTYLQPQKMDNMDRREHIKYSGWWQKGMKIHIATQSPVCSVLCCTMLLNNFILNSTLQYRRC